MYCLCTAEQLCLHFIDSRCRFLCAPVWSNRKRLRNFHEWFVIRSSTGRVVNCVCVCHWPRSNCSRCMCRKVEPTFKCIFSISSDFMRYTRAPPVSRTCSDASCAILIATEKLNWQRAVQTTSSLVEIPFFFFFVVAIAISGAFRTCVDLSVIGESAIACSTIPFHRTERITHYYCYWHVDLLINGVVSFLEIVWRQPVCRLRSAVWMEIKIKIGNWRRRRFHIKWHRTNANTTINSSNYITWRASTETGWEISQLAAAIAAAAAHSYDL